MGSAGASVAQADVEFDPFESSPAQLDECLQEGLQRFQDHRALYGSGGMERLTAGAARFEVLREDRVYRQIGDQALSVTIYRPRVSGPGRRFPALLQLHGGGWIGGSRDQLGDFSVRLAGMGMVVVTSDYRFAPRNPFPAAPEDVAAAAAWIGDRSDELGVDRQAGLTVFGFSAGANLAGGLAMSEGVASGRDFPVTRAVLLSGRADLMAPRSGGFDYSTYYLGGGRLEFPDLYRRASPIYQIPQASPRLPEVLLIHQLTDDVIPWEQSCRFENALRAQGGHPRLMLLPEPGPAHGPTGENRQLVLQAMAYFLGLI